MALTTLIVVAIVIGLQAVGVVLMSAMIIAPAAAARQWTDRLGVMVGLSMAFGALSGVSGTLLSGQMANVPTGPTIVLCASALVLGSLLGAPRRGLVARWMRQRRNSRRLRLESVLLDLYALADQHERYDHPHAASALNAMNPQEVDVRRRLRTLAERGLVRSAGDGRWALTNEGRREAEALLRAMRAGNRRAEARERAGVEERG